MSDRLPDDLDAWLAENEAGFDGLAPEAVRRIVWLDPATREQTPVAVVYLHGFSATPPETRPLADLLASRLGANLYYHRFRGHGLGGDALLGITLQDWQDDTREAYAIGRRLGERVLLVGTSTGGTAATWLAANTDPAGLLALVLLSPNFGPRHPGALLLLHPWGVKLGRRLFGPCRSFLPANEGHARYWTTRYPVEALVPMMQLVHLTKKEALQAVRTPTLMLYCADDRIVSPRLTRRAFAKLAAPARRLTEIAGVGDPYRHVLAGDILSPQTTDGVLADILAFVEPLLSSP